MQDTMKHEFAARRGSDTLTAALVDWLAFGLFALDNGHKMPASPRVLSETIPATQVMLQ